MAYVLEVQVFKFLFFSLLGWTGATVVLASFVENEHLVALLAGMASLPVLATQIYAAEQAAKRFASRGVSYRSALQGLALGLLAVLGIASGVAIWSLELGTIVSTILIVWVAGGSVAFSCSCLRAGGLLTSS